MEKYKKERYIKNAANGKTIRQSPTANSDSVSRWFSKVNQFIFIELRLDRCNRFSFCFLCYFSRQEFWWSFI